MAARMLNRTVARVLIVTSLVIAFQAISHGEEPAWASAPSLGVSKVAKLKEFLSEICKVTPLSVTELKVSAENYIGRNQVRLRINEKMFFTLDQETGHIYNFSTSITHVSCGSQEATFPATYKETDVYEMCRNVLRMFDQPEDISQYQIGQPVLDKEDSRYGDWEVLRRYSVKGIPCRNRFFSICIHPINDCPNILGVYNYPVILPKTDVLEPISKERAIESAARWFKSVEYLAKAHPNTATDVESRIVKVIASPNGFLDMKHPNFRGTSAEYCWEVPFSWTESRDLMESGVAFKGVAWVSLDKGEVIGGRCEE